MNMAVADIKPAPYNPAVRTTKQALRRLLESIQARGIIVPLVVDANGNLVDGHRRLACAKLLGMETVPVVIAQTEPDGLYAELADTTRRINGKEATEIYSKGGKAPRAHQAALQEIERLLGPEWVRRIVDERLSGQSILAVAHSICRYTGTDASDDDWMWSVLIWLVEGHRQAMAHWAILDRMAPKELCRAVREGRDIRRTWYVR